MFMTQFRFAVYTDHGYISQIPYMILQPEINYYICITE